MEIPVDLPGIKIYKGHYRYFKEKATYCEEDFEVYKNPDGGIYFLANQQMSVEMDRILKISITYSVTPEFQPQEVSVQKSLGAVSVKERYYFYPHKKLLEYAFESEQGVVQRRISPPLKFTVATPCACTSMLHMKTKKEGDEKNYYKTVAGHNLWKFESEPMVQSFIMEKMLPESLEIDGQQISAATYRLFDDQRKDFLKVCLSEYFAIPYVIEASGARVEMTYLRNC